MGPKIIRKEDTIEAPREAHRQENASGVFEVNGKYQILKGGKFIDQIPMGTGQRRKAWTIHREAR